MIEPLQYNKEHYPPYEIARPVFCHSCLCQKNSRLDPHVAVKFCPKCPSTVAAEKDYGAFLCAECDDKNHKASAAKHHVRLLLVVGPGVRKKVVVRGDGRNFPLPLDHVTVKLSSRIYQNGRRVHRIKPKEVSFISGMSGRCLHVQVLGARNLMVGDIHGSSDPFIVYTFCGKPLGTTRIRPRSTNPRWDNETFIVPMDENLPAPRDMPQSQRDLVRLEVYDHDWVTNSEFLGHVEITRSKLMKIAAIAHQSPIRLPLTMKEYHGFVNLQFGYDENFLHVKAVRAENLNMMHAQNLSNPYIKIYLGNSFLVGTTTTLVKTINPQWATGNVFKIKMLQFLFAERYALSQIDAYNETQDRQARARGDTSQQYQSGSMSQMMDEFSNLPTNLALFRVELYHDNRWRKHQLLGKAYISVHKLRKMLPSLPSADVNSLAGFSDYVVATAKADHASAKLQAQLDKQSPWWSCFDFCRGRKPTKERPSSPLPVSGGVAMGRLPGANATTGAPPPLPGNINRRRGNLLGAASAGGANFPGASAPPLTNPEPSAPPLPSGVRPPPPRTPPSQSAQSEDSFGFSARAPAEGAGAGLALPADLPPGLSNRRSRRPMTISVDTPAFTDLAQLPSDSSPDAFPGYPVEGSGKFSDKQSSGKSAHQRPETAPEPGGGSARGSARGSGTGSVRGSVRGSTRGSDRGSDVDEAESKSDIEEGPGESLYPTEASPRAAGVNLPLGIADIDPDQPLPAETQQEIDAIIYEPAPSVSSRPAPPPVPEGGFDRSESASERDPSNRTGTGRAGDEEDDSMQMSSNMRAPFLDRGNSTSNMTSRKSKKLLSLSFRAPAAETVWSESYPFPVMLDLAAHRGVDAFGKAVSQGFIVLRLIPATRGTVVLGLDEAVRQMTVGETAQVKCRFDYAYGAFSMGSNIPPRANVIFKVKLLSVNGHGRYQVLYRQVIRFFRAFTRTWEAWRRYWRGDEEYGNEVNAASKKSKAPMSFSAKVMQRLGLSSRAGTKGSDSESSEGSESEEDEEQGLLQGANADGEDFGPEDGSDEGSSAENENIGRPRVKPDPKMRKHLNPSVQSGAQIMWNFKPPQKVKKPPKAPVKPKAPLYPQKQQKPEAPNQSEEKAGSDEDAGRGEEEKDSGDEEQGGFAGRVPDDERASRGPQRQRGAAGEGVDFDDGYGMDGRPDQPDEEEDRNESDEDGEA